MFGIKYYKADSATFVIKSVNGRIRKKGKGLSFFYNKATTSIAAVPVNAQEAPFVASLQTADFQTVKLQGQITYQIAKPETINEILNFTLNNNGLSYLSEDPMKLSDRIIRIVQTIIQNEIQSRTLRQALKLNQSLVELIGNRLPTMETLLTMGVSVIDTSISAITAMPETSKALEAQAREEILKESDDAIYSRRESAVEQERKIREAELQTTLSVQQKEQEIEESRVANERALLRSQTETEQERLQAEIDAEDQRSRLVTLNVENRKMEADAEAYTISTRMQAFKELPVENLKAIALASMEPDQLIAQAFDSLAQNAGKIGELNISPDLLGQIIRRS
ncbi:SPFH domain-containing protein [Amphritea sp. HPY]|uniref:SPFH domain-containing protein n=1 Tax=Amphritea sp. HPY TaxID=3421652 RepID=UPI003D7E6A91